MMSNQMLQCEHSLKDQAPWWNCCCLRKYEPPNDKTSKMSVHPAKTQINLGTRPVWSESSLSAWRNIGSLATHWAHSEDSDPTGRMRRLIWVFPVRTVTLFVLSCRGSILRSKWVQRFQTTARNQRGRFTGMSYRVILILSPIKYSCHSVIDTLYLSWQCLTVKTTEELAISSL